MKFFAILVVAAVLVQHAAAQQLPVIVREANEHFEGFTSGETQLIFQTQEWNYLTYERLTPNSTTLITKRNKDFSILWQTALPDTIGDIPGGRPLVFTVRERNDGYHIGCRRPIEGGPLQLLMPVDFYIAVLDKATGAVLKNYVNHKAKSGDYSSVIAPYGTKDHYLFEAKHRQGDSISFNLHFYYDTARYGFTIPTPYSRGNMSSPGDIVRLVNTQTGTLLGGFVATASFRDTLLRSGALMFRYATVIEQEWAKTYRMGDFTPVKTLSHPKGGYVIFGYGPDTSRPKGYAVIAAKFSNSGNLQWEKAYYPRENNFAYSAANARDGGFLIFGGAANFKPGVPYSKPDEFERFILKITSDGELVFANSWGDQVSGNWLKCAFEDAVDATILVGGKNQKFPYLARIRPTLTGYAEENDVQISGEIQVYPNPTGGNATLYALAGSRVIIANSVGIIAGSYIVPREGMLQIPANEFTPGIYSIHSVSPTGAPYTTLLAVLR